MSSVLREHILPSSILVEGPIDPQNVNLRVGNQGISFPPEARVYIDEKWQERLRLGRSFRDTPTITLIGINKTPDNVIILGAPAMFSERSGTGQLEFRQRFGDGFVVQGIGVNALVKTGDGYILVGQRNTYRAGKTGGLHMVGGGLDSGEDLLNALFREAEEEAGIHRHEWGVQKLLGITQSKETKGVDVAYLGETPLTREEIAVRPTDGELGRVFYPDTPNETRRMLLGFLRTASTSVIAALYLYGKQSYGIDWAEEILDRIERMSQAFEKYSEEQVNKHMLILANRLSGF